MAGRRQRGFTLLELLAAVAVMAVMGAIAYGGLISLARNQDRVSAEADSFQRLALTMALIERDIRAAVPRPVRDELGDPEPAMSGGRGGLAFTRAGWSNPTGQARASLQRVSYSWDNGRLLRVYWPVLDRTQATRPITQPLLDGVDLLAVQFLPSVGADEWINSWPPPRVAADGPPPWPAAVRVVIEGRELGHFERVLSLAVEQ